MEGRSLFLGLIGSPYESDMFTTASRLVDETVRRRHHVTVWACGYSTALTLRGLGDSRPRNPWSWDTVYPSTAAVVQGMLAYADGRLEWLVCRFCAEERGSTDQMPGVRIEPPANFQRRALAADVCLMLGVK
ncbi:MAG TPA: hypothetical protein VFC19_52225 [Candidatus Limnocylindrales bacterium]|nr:hypothetical protein [Candidatus Limnocylindrales bacterium]